MQALTDESRRSPRSKVLLSAVLEWPDAELKVVLRDLSEHGALIETPTAAVLDSDLFFRRNDLRVRGWIAWRSGNYAGIAFARPLKPEVVLQHIARPARAKTDASLHRRPALTRHGMSAEEQRWAEQLMNRRTQIRGK
jgi:hypothetical protein